MKHRKKIVKLGRMSSHRFAMFYNMATSVLKYKKIHTTVPKAKAVVQYVDKLITFGKEGTLHAKRLAYKILKDHSLVSMLFADIAPILKDKKGGYTRIIRTGNRPGDGAPMAILELIGFESSVKPETTGKKAEKPEKKTAKSEKPAKEAKKIKKGKE